MAQRLQEEFPAKQNSPLLPPEFPPSAFCEESAEDTAAQKRDMAAADVLHGNRPMQTHRSSADIQRLCRQGRRYLLLNRLLRTTFLTLICAATVSFGIACAVSGNWQIPYNMLPTAFALRIALGLLFAFSLTGLFLSWKGTQTAKTIAGTGDVNTIGTLLDLLAQGDENRPLLVFSLTGMLPRLQATDAVMLTGAQRACLQRELSRSARKRRRAQSYYAIAILKALEQIGASEALPLVQKLANAPEHQALPAVRQAARDCLPYLQERVARQQASQTLLRAAHEDQSVPETLLRPAPSIIEDSPQTMLRPAGLQISDEERP